MIFETAEGLMDLRSSDLSTQTKVLKNRDEGPEFQNQSPVHA
jgi:hypothetical protein